MDTTTPPASDAPDGAPPTPPAAGAPPDGRDPAEQMSRGAFEKLVQQRDAEKATTKALTEELAALKAKLTAPAPAPAPVKVPDGAPDWFKAHIDETNTKLDSLTKQLEGQAGQSRESVIAAVLEQVPHGGKTTARALLPHLGIELSSPTAAADALAILKNQHPAVMADQSRGVVPRAPQVGADGKPDFSIYNTPDEIPPEHREAAFADPATLARIQGNLGGGSERKTDGYNI